MSTLTVIDNEFATLVYYPDQKIVHHTFHKPIAGPEFRAVLNAGIELLHEHAAQKWLSDDRGNTALPEDDTKWSQQNWFPRAQEAGWKYWALVVPQNFMAQFNLNEFVSNYSYQGLRVMVFTEPEQALDWLSKL